MAILPGQGCRMDVGHVGPLVVQQPGHGKMGVQGTFAVPELFLALLRCINLWTIRGQLASHGALCANRQVKLRAPQA